MPDALAVYELDGARVQGLSGLWDEVERVLLPPGTRWGRSLDAFNDVLRGGFGTPDEGFVLRIVSAGQLREALGHAETARWLEGRLPDVHPGNRHVFEQRLDDARAGRGRTLFDEIVEIIGERAADGVTLDLVE
ncbi:MAG: barstar family protein [Myxococcaceae bacterium]|jgi:hypothetical protein|nr:barstar family protein [Myxococcaceae bacterium]